MMIPVFKAGEVINLPLEGKQKEPALSDLASTDFEPDLPEYAATVMLAYNV